MHLQQLGIADLEIEDRRSFAHVALYGRLETWLRSRNARFAVVKGPRPDHALLLNLAFWKPGDVLEVLPDDIASADQIAHNAWHAIAADALGDAASSARGLLLAESIASAFDIYLVGRLVGHAPDSQFLATQVPAMADAAADAGLEEEAFMGLVEDASRTPEKAFESLRQLLFDTAVALYECDDVDAAASALAEVEGHRFACLLHHYELSTWVLFARCYGRGDDAEAVAIDANLREADDSLAWLEKHWLAT